MLRSRPALLASRLQRLRSTATALPERVDAVVIGGGSVGAATAFHLQQRGLKTLLLEAHELTAGTTWHTAGMLWRLRPSYVDIELLGHTRDMCKWLERDTEIGCWTENGGLFIADNKERLMEYERLAETGAKYGIESRVLSPAEVRDVHPLLAVDDVYGALYSPGDGTIDPSGVVHGYVKAARKRGATVAEGVRVGAIETEEVAAGGGGTAKRVTAVVTEDGRRIHTTHVVNACGAWAGRVGEMMGIELPLLAMKHAYVVTEALPGMHGGLPNVRDHDLSVYLKAQGECLAIGGYEVNPEFWDDVDPGFSFGLFELDWETFLQNTEGHIKRCPAIERAGMRSTVCGPESFTPDHKPLVGPQPGLRGAWHACGFNSAGMMLAGGAARELASWVADGAPSLDMFGYDPARFHAAACVADAKWVKDTTHEAYAKNYAIVFRDDEQLAGRGARKSALHEQLARRGCVFQARHGHERPGWFVPALAAATGQGGGGGGGASLEPLPYDYYGAYAAEDSAWRLGSGAPADVPAHAEHAYLRELEGELTFGWPASMGLVAEEVRAAREGAAIFDQSYFGKLFVRGADADAAMQWLCGADLEGKRAGSVTYTPLCNARGGVEADLTVTKLADGGMDGGGWYLCTGGATQSHDIEWVRRALEAGGFGGGGVTLSDESDEHALLSIQGPKSHALLAPLVADGAIDDLDAFGFSTCREVTLAGHRLKCLRLTFVGELGFELHVPKASAAAVYEAVRAAGDALEARTGAPVRDAGYRAIDSLSAEKSYRHWHADLGCADTPLEAGIGFTVLPKLKRDDGVAFLGREALVAQRARGVTRKLVTLTIDGEETPPLQGGETIWRDGACVGVVRSAAYGHTLRRNIAIGYCELPADATVAKITNKWLEQGTWAVRDRGTIHSATLHVKAPFDPGNLRVKGEYEDAESAPLAATA